MPKAHHPELIRLQKVISSSGVTSRRKAEQLIRLGKVKVNGVVITEMGTKVDPLVDCVEVNDNSIEMVAPEDKIYLILNKPRGYMTTLSDPEGRPTVMDLCSEVVERIYPVGRLDYNSEGLLILTNDGELANHIMHPRYEIIKVYEVKIFGIVNEAILRNLSKGIQSETGFLKPKSVRLIKRLPGKTWLEFRLNEGKNREIRRPCEAFNLTIDKLRRVAIGGLSIQGIAPGRSIRIEKKELLRQLGMDKRGNKLPFTPSFQSTKKALNVSKKFRTQAPDADNPIFQIFRKENYVTTMQKRKEVKAQELEAKAIEITNCSKASSAVKRENQFGHKDKDKDKNKAKSFQPSTLPRKSSRGIRLADSSKPTRSNRISKNLKLTKTTRPGRPGKAVRLARSSKSSIASRSFRPTRG